MAHKDRPEDRDAVGALLPVDSSPCVWMTAGVVAYKICDRGYDCEHCPLDAGLCGRELAGLDSSAEAAPVADAAALEFPPDRLYHGSHVWAQPFERALVRVGIDAFAARLLSGATSLVLPADGAVVQQGRVGFWIAEETRLVPLISPVSGRVRRRNHWVQASPGLVTEAPYGHGWLIDVDCPNWAIERRRLVSAESVRELARRQSESLRKHVAHYVEHGQREVGATMADGGERLVDARRILGPARYRRLVLSFLR
jgi:glycine cleavage system H protein